ncbi:polysaccharide pyruvyl transferase family protein [Niallia circulans]|uniref:Polysaccharide pyruvyl transferase family protein n=1 Tax=Niallia circulans TaxID=1397 RepID=A0A941GHH1_NIACI|nr:polysaccharide pyruvyl transferase family protein [Niallia circulans]MCB5237687.1 polysaccharide pyruvyl transferase family protein [Niallia circulans]
MKNILIINAHSSKNKGDAAIIISMIQTIREVNPNCNIIISSRYPEHDRLYEQFGCKVVEQLTRFPDKGLSFFDRLKFLLKELIGSSKFVKTKKAPKYRNPEVFQAYLNSDIIVSCGGGFIYSHPKFHMEASLIMHLAQIYFAKKIGKPVITYAQSIGPFKSKLSQLITKHVLRKVDHITIREELSKNFLADIGVKNNVEVVGDSAFTMKNEVNTDNISDIVANITGQQFSVGVTVRQWEFPNKKNPKLLYDNYVNSVAEAVSKVIEIKKATVYLVPQVTGPTSIEDDRIASGHVWNKLSDDVKKSVVFLKDDYSPMELHTIYSNFDMFIGTRMHSNIFALSSKVPTIGISYEPKTTGIMRMMGLSNYVLDINKITVDKLNNTLHLTLSSLDEYKLKLSKEIPLMQEKAKKPAVIIKNILFGF